jgi:hypothetical protein
MTSSRRKRLCSVGALLSEKDKAVFLEVLNLFRFTQSINVIYFRSLSNSFSVVEFKYAV